MKIKSYYTSILIVLILLISGCSKDEGFHFLFIKNETPHLISNLSIEYMGSKKILPVGNLYPYSVYQYKIDTLNSEDSLNVSYKKTNGVQVDLLAVPYFAKYDKKNYYLNIK